MLDLHIGPGAGIGGGLLLGRVVEKYLAIWIVVDVPPQQGRDPERTGVGDADADITPYGEIMQQIALPVGTSSIRFRFAPPYAGLCWAMVAAGLLGLLPYRRRRI